MEKKLNLPMCDVTLPIVGDGTVLVPKSIVLYFDLSSSQHTPITRH